MKSKQTRTHWLLLVMMNLCLFVFATAGHAADVYVRTTGSDVPSATGSSASPFKTINYAVSRAAAGDIIRIGGGVFTEQVEISKNLTLVGEGISATTIKSPATLTKYFTTNANYFPVVYIHDAASVTIQNLTVDGNANIPPSVAFVGVAYRNAGGLVTNSKVISITNNPAFSNQFGYGLLAFADNGTARTLTVSGSSFVIFQKLALALLGPNLTGVADGNTIEGAGQIDQLAQIGIQVSIGAAGTVKNNKIKNIVYRPATETATAILIDGAKAPVSVTDNEVTDCQTAIYLANTSGTIARNKLVFNAGSYNAAITYWWGILARNGVYTISENDINGGGGGTGIDGFGLANDLTNVTVLNNMITNMETGISTEVDEPPACVIGEIHYNSVTNTKEPLYNNQNGSSDCPVPCATCNWFGSANDSDFAGKFAGGGSFRYSPWLTNGTDAQPGMIGFQPAPNSINCVCAPLGLTVKSKTNVLCYGENDGTAVLKITGGTAPYKYKLDADEDSVLASTEFTVADLEPGTHTVVVTDNTGAAKTVTIEISQPVAKLDAQATATADVKCNGASNGSVTITATGGVGPYKVVERPTLASFTSTITVSDLSVGETTLTIRDANGCEDQVTVTLAEPTKLMVEATDQKTSCNGNTGSVTITAIGGTAPYTGTGIKAGLAPGTYTFTVTDAKGCTASVVVTIDGTGTAGGFNVMPETFPYQFNTTFTKSLLNRTFIGSSGTWTVTSDNYATAAVLTPYYAPSSSYALKILNFKTYGCADDGSVKAVSPKLNLTGPCCPDELKFNFTLWSYACVANDTKAALKIDFSSDNGATWTEVWSRTSAQLYSAYGANGKASISIGVPLNYQTANFRYRIRGEMAPGDNNNFYVFIDDIIINSPATCTPKGSIGDFVWNDVNKNGKQDAGEQGIANVSVKLTLPDGSTQTKTTSSSGYYLFTGLSAGNYTVTFTTPNGFVPTLSNVPSDDAIDSDPVNGVVNVPLGVGENNRTIDAGYYVPVCTNTTNHSETFPNKYNTNFTTSLYNKTFVGSSGTWTVNSDSKSTLVVTTPYYSPSSSYALKVVNYKTSGCGSSSAKAVSPKVDISEPCCPSQLKFNFTLWTYKVACNDSKAKLEIDFSNNNGATWYKVWSVTSGTMYYYVGANGKVGISLAIPAFFQTENFRYRIRGEMASGDANNFYVFIDDIKIGSPSSCATTNSCDNRVTSARVAGGTVMENFLEEPVVTNKPDLSEIGAVDISFGVQQDITYNTRKTESVKQTIVESLKLQPVTAGKFSVNVFPNPTNAEFEIRFTSKDNTPVIIRIVDMAGRVVKQFNSKPGASIRFGSDLTAGSYLAEVQQGTNKEVIKLVKM